VCLPFERNVLIVTHEYKHVIVNVRCKPYLYNVIVSNLDACSE